MSNEIIDMGKSESGTWEEIQVGPESIPNEIYEIFTSVLFKGLASMLEVSVENVHDNIQKKIRK